MPGVGDYMREFDEQFKKERAEIDENIRYVNRWGTALVVTFVVCFMALFVSGTAAACVWAWRYVFGG